MNEMAEVDFTQRSSVRAAVVWGLAALFYLYELMLLVSPSVMVNDLSAEFNTSAEQLGSLSAFYYYAYALMQIPVGLLIDRFGPRKLLTVASVLCAIGCLVFAYSQNLLSAQVGRFIMGLGGSFAVVSCLKLSSMWFPIHRFALLTGLMVAIGMMGGVFGQAPVAKLVMAIGWRDASMIGAGIAFFMSVLIALIIADHPFMTPKNQSHPLENHDLFAKTGPQTISIIAGLKAVMKMPQVWIVSIFAGLMFVPTTGFGQLWGVPYFIERFQIPKDSAAFAVSMIFFGWAIGGPLYGWLSDKIGLRKLPMWFAAVGTLLVLLMIFYLPVSLGQAKLLMLLLGLFSSGFVLAFSVIREINIPILTGTAIGFINTINNASGALAQPILGKLLDKFYTGAMVLGEPVYTVAVYNKALLFLPLCIVLSWFVLPFIRETHCRTVN